MPLWASLGDSFQGTTRGTSFLQTDNHTDHIPATGAGLKLHFIHQIFDQENPPSARPLLLACYRLIKAGWSSLPDPHALVLDSHLELGFLDRETDADSGAGLHF